MASLVACFRFAVIPAKAGIHADLLSVAQTEDRPLLRTAPRAIDSADVHFGASPSKSGFRRDDDGVLT